MKHFMLYAGSFQFAAVAKTVLKDGPNVCTALEKQEIGMQRILQDYVDSINQSKSSSDSEKAAMTSKIIRNTAKIQHAREEMQQCVNEAEEAAKKIFSVDRW